jgi:hypothetical protein
MDTHKIEETIKKDAIVVEEKTIFAVSWLKNWAMLNPKKAIFLLGFIVGFILGTLF